VERDDREKAAELVNFQNGEPPGVEAALLLELPRGQNELLAAHGYSFGDEGTEHVDAGLDAAGHVFWTGERARVDVAPPIDEAAVGMVRRERVVSRLEQIAPRGACQDANGGAVDVRCASFGRELIEASTCFGV